MHHWLQCRATVESASPLMLTTPDPTTTPLYEFETSTFRARNLLEDGPLVHPDPEPAVR
jgi:hypothetical protein